MAIPAAIMIAMSGEDAKDDGLASGLNKSSKQACAAVVTSVLESLAASTTTRRLADGASDLLALRDVYVVAWLTAAAFVLAALTLATVIGRE